MGRTKTVNVEDQIARAVLTMAARDGGVDGITATAVARAAKMSVKAVEDVVLSYYPCLPPQMSSWRGPGSCTICETPGYQAFLPFLSAWVSAQLPPMDTPEGTSPRDRLFDRIMSRIDILQVHRSGFIPIARAVMQDPRAWLVWGMAVWPALSTPPSDPGKGVPGHIIENIILTMVYILTLRKWLNDETADLGPTMAELDRRLAQAERLQSFAI